MRFARGPGVRAAIVSRLLLPAVVVALSGTSLAGQEQTPPPTGLEGRAVSGTEVDLAWNPPSNLGGLTVNQYNVYRDSVQVASTTDTTYSDTGLQPATSYRYYVTAVSTLAGESEPSNEVTVTTQDTTPPTVPEDLRTTAVGTTSVALAWSVSSDPESGVDRYRVYRDGSVVAEPSATDYTDTGLSPETSYSYRVSAVNGEGLESGRSGGVTATTEASSDSGGGGSDGGNGGAGEDTVPPAPPTNVRVET